MDRDEFKPSIAHFQPAGQRLVPRPAGFFVPAMCPPGQPFRARLQGDDPRVRTEHGPLDVAIPGRPLDVARSGGHRMRLAKVQPRLGRCSALTGRGRFFVLAHGDRTRTRSRPLSRDRTRCPRCPASRGTTRCRHRQAVVARVPRRARPVVRTRPRVWRGALHPRARCRPARQDAADS
jgi:hypothetical protein